MKNIRVKELMTPIVEYPAVSRKATLREALLALQKAEKRFAPKGCRPRAVLIMDEDQRMIGKLNAWDVLRALDPKYKSIGDEEAVSHYGWTAAFVKSMMTNYGLLQGPLDEMCWRIADIEVGEIMTSADEKDLIHQEKQIIEDEAPLNEAIHLFVMGDFTIMLVRRDEQIVGILRLVDVFDFISTAIRNRPVEND